MWHHLESDSGDIEIFSCLPWISQTDKTRSELHCRGKDDEVT